MILWPIHEANDCHEPAGSPEGGRFCSTRVPVGVKTTHLRDYDSATRTYSPAGDARWYSFDTDVRLKPVAQRPFTRELADALEATRGWSEQFKVLRQYLQPPTPPPGHVVMFRIGRGGSLSGRNAANLEGLAQFIDQEGGDFASATGFIGRTIFTYVVKIGQEGDYHPQRQPT